MRNLFFRRWPLQFHFTPLAFCYAILGILIGNQLQIDNATIIALLSIGLAGFLILIINHNTICRLFPIPLACLALFSALSAHQALSLPFIAQSTHSVTIEGTLDAPPKIKKRSMQLSITLPDNTKIIGWIRNNQLTTPLSYGDTLQLTGTFIAPNPPTNPGEFDYPSYLQKKQIQGLFKISHIEKIGHQFANPFKRIAYHLKEKVLEINRRSLPDPYSEMYTGVIFGEHGTQLPEDIKQNFQKTGLMHLLVVSGSQVSLISSVLWTLTKYLPIPRIPRYLIITIANIIFYFLTGGGNSIFRAILMNQTAMFAQTLHRQANAFHVMSLSGLVLLLIDPMALTDVGAQLSFIATFALLYGARVLKDILPKKWPELCIDTLSVSLSPFIFSTPILWHHFHTLSPISLLTNLLIISASEIIVVIGFFSTVIGFVFFPLCYIINQFSYWVLLFLDYFTQFFANIPFASITIDAPPLGVILLIYVLLILFFEGLRKKNHRISAGWALSLSLVIFTITIWQSLPNKTLTITMIDVGQGESILIQTPHHKTILIDGGNQELHFKTKEELFNAGKRHIEPVLTYYGIHKIDMMILSHYDKDHYGGFPFIINRFPVSQFIDADPDAAFFKDPTHPFYTLKDKRTVLKKPSKIQLEKDLQLEFLWPITPLPKASKNNQSIVIKLTYKNTTLLFTGDLEKESEEALITHYQDRLDCDILKVGHHGSKTSSIPAFLNTVTPKIALISAGRNNRYHHPHPSIIHRLAEKNIQIYRTDKQGALLLKTNGKKTTVHSFLENPKVF